MSLVEPVPRADDEVVRIVLFVAGETPRSARAIQNLQALVDACWQDRCEVQIVDVLKSPELAEEARILATPTLIKRSPPPSRRLTGDLSDVGKVRFVLGAEPAPPPPSPGL